MIAFAFHPRNHSGIPLKARLTHVTGINIAKRPQKLLDSISLSLTPAPPDRLRRRTAAIFRKSLCSIKLSGDRQPGGP